jgi:hypothetical protein
MKNVGVGSTEQLDIYEPGLENQVAVIEFEPQYPHNNTTGEMHEHMLQIQQQNGPIGGEAMVKNQLLRNSIEYKDAEMNNFMVNPDEEKEKELMQRKR